MSLSTMSSDVRSPSVSPGTTHLIREYRVFAGFKYPLLGQLASSLTHLHLTKAPKSVWQSLTPMRALTSLTLQFSRANRLTDILPRLAPFNRLTELKLSKVTYFILMSNLLELAPKDISLLATVKRLTLVIDFQGTESTDFTYFLRTIRAAFPALEGLTLLIGPLSSGNHSRLRQQAEMMRLPLELGASLFDSMYDDDPFDEMLHLPLTWD